MSGFTDLKNQRFGKLLVLDYSPIFGKPATWLCRCDCGKTIVTSAASLRAGRSKSCGCTRKRKRLPIGVVAEREFLASYRDGANIRELIFNLPIEVFIQLIYANCYYCDAAPVQRRTHKDRHGGLICNGIDRLDNNLGYTIDNCVTCCKECNHAKHTQSLDEYIYRSIRIARKWGLS